MKASEWRERAQAFETRRAVDLTLPSGAVIKFCRPSLFTWISSGRVPETFTATLEKVVNSGDTTQEKLRAAEQALIELSAEDQNKYQTFLNDLIIASVIEPKIVLGFPKSDDEIGMAEIPEEDITFILTQALALAPTVPVETKGGDVPLQDIEDFRDESEGSIPVVPGSDLREVPSEAV